LARARVVIVIADDADGADGIFFPRTDPDHSGSSSAFTTKGDVDAQYPKECLRTTQSAGKFPGTLGPSRGPAREAGTRQGCTVTAMRRKRAQARPPGAVYRRPRRSFHRGRSRNAVPAVSQPRWKHSMRSRIWSRASRGVVLAPMICLRLLKPIGSCAAQRAPTSVGGFSHIRKTEGARSARVCQRPDRPVTDPRARECGSIVVRARTSPAASPWTLPNVSVWPSRERTSRRR